MSVTRIRYRRRLPGTRVAYARAGATSAGLIQGFPNKNWCISRTTTASLSMNT